jgi:hypothetical protein
MHHGNHFYGHAHILARYCGLDDGAPPRIRGYLQHGWNILDGFASGMSFLPGAAKFVWSDGPRRRGALLGRRHYYVLGAPWIYLLTLEPELGRMPDGRREGTIWYPFHGWEGQHIVGDHDGLIAEIRDTETGPVTVCLYWQEYRDKRVRALYERAGFRVICHGYRGGWWKDLDPGFLYRQLAEQRKHSRVASNRLCSAIMYGTLAGCEPAVYGDPMQLEGEKSAFGGQGRIVREWAELHGPSVDVEAARSIAVAELGADRLLPPAELRRLFQWPSLRADPDLELTGALTR